MDVLNKIKDEMRKRKWTQAELARVADIPHTTLNSLFRKNNQPTIPTLESICKAFGITISDFFNDGETPTTLNPEQLAMFEKWSKLTPAQKAALMALIESI